MSSSDPWLLSSSDQSSTLMCDLSIYTMDHPDFIVCSFMENSTGLKIHI